MKPKLEVKVRLGPEPDPTPQPDPTAKPVPTSKPEPSPTPEWVQAAEPQSHIEAFFLNYPHFDYNRSKPAMGEFYRMCRVYRWKDTDEAKNEARQGIKDALTQQFNLIYGTDENDLCAWQNLCRVLQHPNVPEDLELCRKVSLPMYLRVSR